MPRTTEKNYTPAQNGIIWARVSSEEQKLGYSLDAQKNLVNDYCKKHSINVLKTFTVTESSTRGKRGQFHEMIKFVKKQNGCIAIVCDKTDRLLRSFKEAPILEELRKNGKIELHFRAENRVVTMNSQGPDIMAYNLFILLAQNYTDCISDNVKRSNKEMRENGRWGYFAPIGYLNERDEKNKPTVVPDPERKLAIQEIFQQYATGLFNLTDMVNLARKLKLKSKGGKYLNKETIRRMLTNRFYIGEMYCKGRYYKHQYNTFINRDIFNKCQEVAKEKGTPKKQKNKHLFQGLIRCHHCGTRISTDIKKGRWSYLFCPKCKNTRVNEQVAKNIVYDTIKSLTSIPQEKLNNVLQQVEKRILNDTKTEREMKIRVETRLANYSKERELTLDLYTSGRITLDQYDKKVQLIEQNRLNDEEELLSMSNINTQLSISLKTLVNLVSHANQIFESSNFDEKRKFLKILFSNFILDGKNPVFSIRKPVLTLVKTGSRPKWQGQ